MNDALSSLFSLSQSLESRSPIEPAGSEPITSSDFDFGSAFAKAFSRLQAERQSDAEAPANAAAQQTLLEAESPDIAHQAQAETLPTLQELALGSNLTLVVPAEPVPDEDLVSFAQSQGIPLGALAQLQARPIARIDPFESTDHAVAELGLGGLAAGDPPSRLISVGMGQTETIHPAAITTLMPIGKGLESTVPEAVNKSFGKLTSLEGKSGESVRSQTSLKVMVVQEQWKAYLDRHLGSVASVSSQDSRGVLPPLDLSEFSSLFEDLAVGLEAPTRRVASTQAYLSASGQVFEGLSEGGASSGVQSAGEGSGAGLGQGQMGGETARMLAQQLSQKFGELMGQRLIQQIQQGHWKVELELHPADLGPIEVELNWNGGELEAIFRAVHGTTRDLLQENLPKLRSALEQSGTDVAYLGVGSEQRRQSGGQSSGRDTEQRNTPAAPGAEVEQRHGVSGLSEGLSIWV
ncbi:T3SS_Flik_C domain containing protein [Burkholderiales bacterium]